HYTISKCLPEAQDCTVGKPTTVVYATGTTKIQPSVETHYTVPETDTVVPTEPVETEPVETETEVPTKPVETEPVETQPAVSYTAPQPTATQPAYEQPTYEQPAQSQSAQTYSEPDAAVPAPLAATTEESDDGVEEKTVPVTGAAGRLTGNIEVVLAAAGVIALLL
ncbi:hypothetical protein CEP52_017873, partial [Fusarium oligoseptatum]